MCEPVSAALGISKTAMWLLGATAVAGAAASVYGYRQQAKNIQSALAQQQDQINDQAQQKAHQRMEEARALRAQARAAAAEAGVAGNSVAVMLDDIMGQAGRDVALYETNRKNAIDASGAEARARLRSAKAEMVSGLVNTGLSTYANYAQYRIDE